MRRLLLRVDAVVLLVAAIGGQAEMEIAGRVVYRGIAEAALRGPPIVGIGFIAAHGLAFIVGILLWRAASSRSWHLTGTAIHLLLGCANLAFWRLYIEGDVLVVGYAATALHALFATAQFAAALASAPDVPR